MVRAILEISKFLQTNLQKKFLAIFGKTIGLSCGQKLRAEFNQIFRTCTRGHGIRQFRTILIKLLITLMGEPPQNWCYFSKNSLIDISGHSKPISTKSSEMNFPTREWRMVKKNSGICYPFWGQPNPPFSKSRSISANYEPFSTKFSGICILIGRLRIGEKMLKNFTPS